MAKLILTFKGEVLGEYPIDKDRITIGRKPHNDIWIDNLAVSGEHAAVVNIYNYHFIEDLGSTNGTQINGTDIKKQVLKHNDVIHIGKHELKYINEDDLSNTETDKTVAIRTPGVAAVQSAPAAEKSHHATPTSSVYLKILNGPNAGRFLNLTTASTTIGRQGAQLAVIIKQTDGFHIATGAGKSKPTVNGEAVEKKQRLLDKDIIELDNIRMQFCETGK
jgi:pSer/pThr/pTyr-binding forkhead associated (FHA) protein